MIPAIGLSAAAASIMALVPQVWKTWTTKSAHDLSIKWLSASIICQTLWFIFGALSGILPVLITSISVFIMMVCLVIMKRKYDSIAP